MTKMGGSLQTSLTKCPAAKLHVHRAPGLMGLRLEASALYTTPVRLP